MTVRGALALITHQCRYELHAVHRDRQAGLTTVVMPVLLLVAFVALAGRHATVIQDGRSLSIARFYVPGLIAFAVVGSSFATLLVEIVVLRQTGVLKRRRATPVPGWALIAGRIVAALVVALLTTGILLAVGRNSYDLHIAPAALPAVALTTALGTAAFATLAYALAPFIRDAGGVQPVVQIVLLPLYIISGVLLPDSKNPHALQEIASAFPLQHIAHGLHRAFTATDPGIGMTATDLAVLSAWVAAGLLVAAREFQWLPR
jgi:ABC-2 type transport system permease protein